MAIIGGNILMAMTLLKGGNELMAITLIVLGDIHALGKTVLK